MKKNIAFSIVVTAIAVLISCNKVDSTSPTGEDFSNPEPHSILTKGVGEKTPSIICYVETNDVNPLNAGDYYFPNGETVIDYVVLFASNIHKTLVGGVYQPTLYFNDKLTPYVLNADTYITPLQDQNQAVLLGILGDWVDLGLSNMTTTQAEQLATIVAYAVGEYGFDGISLDDEYSGNNVTPNNYSYSTFINKYRQLRPYDIIHVFDWGATDTISSTAAAEINYAGHGYFGYYLTYNYSDITGMNAAIWSPISLLLGQTYTMSELNTIQTWAANAKSNNYGQILLFNLRSSCPSDNNPVDPIPVFNRIAYGAGWITSPSSVTCSNGGRCPATPVQGGYTITYAMATGN